MQIKLYQKFKQSLNQLLKCEHKLAVAVSGGSDSMALALLLGEFASQSGIKIIALTVDHCLRSNSAEEAAQVTKYLGARNIEHHILKWDEAKNLSNIQAKARKARYVLMGNFCAMNGIKTLCVGHTLDDQAETFLMRLMRGSGIDGLAAIAPESMVFGIRVIRPMLGLTRLELQEYLISQKQGWAEDPSNENIKFARVAVRKFINSLDNPPLLSKRLAATATHMARAKNYIRNKTRQSLEEIFTFDELGFYAINISEFRQLHEEERLRSLASALQHTGGTEYNTRFKELAALDARIMGTNPINSCTLCGCEIAPGKKKGEENILFIYREPALSTQCIDIESQSNNQPIEWDGRFICTVSDVFTKDLKITALGKEGYKTIINSGFIKQAVHNRSGFIIPNKVIYSLPALWTLEKLLAVPHIGYYAEHSIKNIFTSKVKKPQYLFKV